MIASNSPDNCGFLLTVNSLDRVQTNSLELWLKSDSGPVKLIINNESVVFFITEKSLKAAQKVLSVNRITYHHRLLSLKTFTQEAVAGIYFKTNKDFFIAKQQLAAASIEVFEGHIRMADRYLMERFVYGALQYTGKAIQKAGYIEVNDAKIRPTQFTPKLSALSVDIECSEDGELFCIGFYQVVEQQQIRKVIMRSDDLINQQSSSLTSDIKTHNSDFSVNQQTSQRSLDYISWVSDEKQLLIAFEAYIQEVDPDIIIGWNVINFDFRLIYQRANIYSLNLMLGRAGGIMRWRNSRVENNQGFIDIDGRVVIDGIAALKAESYQFPSFSLEAIAQHFLGKGKATENVHTRLAEIVSNFRYNKPALAHYNLQDCILVWDIFEKTHLLEFLVFRSQSTGLELDKVGGSVAAFNNLYLPKLHRSGYVSPNLPDAGGLTSPGGYVMDSKPGLYRQVLVLDFKSLYPSIIRTFKIDPLGLIEAQFSPDDAIPGYVGASFSREKHILPKIITELWQQRDQAKLDKDQPRSLAIKILMNSFYGVLGSGGCPFYDSKLASSITMRGHSIMQETAAWIEQQQLIVIYGDTDSIFVLLDESCNDQQAELVGRQLEKDINDFWQKKIHEEFSLKSYLEIEFESHYSRFLMPTIRGAETGSKKRYAGLLKSAGQQQLIFKGLESVRGDWTPLARKFQRELYQLIFDDKDPTMLIKQTVAAILAGQLDHDLIYTKRLRRDLVSYVKNIPPQVKAAKYADELNARLGRQLQYQHKGNVNYLMTLAGPQPQEYITAPADYQHYIDKQIEPIADGILPFIGLSFSQIVEAQLGLF